MFIFIFGCFVLGILPLYILLSALKKSPVLNDSGFVKISLYWAGICAPGLEN
jgi:hypothetical protein